jgi:hypothetical protein
MLRHVGRRQHQRTHIVWMLSYGEDGGMTNLNALLVAERQPPDPRQRCAALLR